jgi:hypothetical protein
MIVMGAKNVTLYSMPYAAIVAAILVAAEPLLPAQVLPQSQGNHRPTVTVSVNRAAKGDRLPVQRTSPSIERTFRTNIVVAPETA